MPSEPFDPYRQWLNIADPTRPLDHYTLLGIERLESDPQIITRAADVQMTKVRRIRPGERLGDWGRLLDQIEAVKVCLLDPSAKAAYDGSLQASSAMQSDPAAPLAVAASYEPPPAEPLTPPRQGFTPVSAPRAIPIPRPEAVAGNAVPNNTAPERAVAAEKPSSPGKGATLGRLLFVGALLLILAGLGVAFHTVLNRPPGEPRLAKVLVSPPQDPQPSIPPPSEPASVPSQPPVEQPPVEQSTVEQLTAEQPPQAPVVESQSVVERPSAEESLPVVENQPVVEEIPVVEETPISPPVVEQPPISPLALEEQPVSPPVQQRPAVKKPPTVKAAEESPAKDIDRRKSAAFKASILAAREAMSHRDLILAKQQLKKADANVQTNEELRELDRLETILGYLGQFWDGISESMSGLEGGGEMVVGKTRVIVVEASAHAITLRVSGRNRTYTIQRMPLSLVKHIGSWAFTGDPASKVFVGSFFLMDADGDREQARKLWKEAVKEGIKLDDLMLELDRK